MKTCLPRRLRRRPRPNYASPSRATPIRFWNCLADWYAGPGRTVVQRDPGPAPRSGPRPAAGSLGSEPPEVCRRWCSTTTRTSRLLRPGAYYVASSGPRALSTTEPAPEISSPITATARAWLRLLRRRARLGHREKVTGIVANGYHVVARWRPLTGCASLLEPGRSEPALRHGRSAHSGLQSFGRPAAFTGDAPCAGDLVTEEASRSGTAAITGRRSSGTTCCPHRSKETVHLALRHVFHRLDRRQRQPRLGLFR